MARDKSRVKQAQKKSGRSQKEAVVTKLSDKVTRAKGMVFTDYQGLTHKQIESFKKALRPVDAEYTITKNTLLKLALSNKVENTEAFEKPTATLFLYGDPVEPLKKLAKLIKDMQMPSVKFGILDGQVLDSAQVIKLSTLPSKEVLLAQLVGGLKSPIFGLHRALSWNMQKLVMTLNAVSQKKTVS